MKAFSESTANTTTTSGALQRVRSSANNSKVQKRRRIGRSRELSESDKKDEENIKQYLNKLQEIVPSLPKNQKLSKVEVIDHVIDYIHELREALGLPQCCNNNNNLPCNNTFSMESIILGRKQMQQPPFHSL